MGPSRGVGARRPPETGVPRARLQSGVLGPGSVLGVRKAQRGAGSRATQVWPSFLLESVTRGERLQVFPFELTVKASGATELNWDFRAKGALSAQRRGGPG